MQGSQTHDTGGVDSSYAWARLGLSMFLATIGGAGMWSVVVVLPAVEREFGVDRADASLPYTATMIGFALGNLFIGRFVDRLGVMVPLALASVLLGSGFLLASQASSIWIFTVLQGAMIGFGSAATFGPLLADVSHWFAKRRGLAVAATASGNYFAGAIWPLVLQAAMSDYGWRGAYILAGCVCLAVLVPMAFLLRRPAPHMVTGGRHVEPPPPVRTTPLSPGALQFLLILAGLGCCVAMSMPQVHIVAYCVDLGYGVARGAEMLSLMLAGGIASRLISGVLADKIGGLRTLLIGAVLQCLALFLYIPYDGLASLYMVSLIFGLSQGGIVSSYAIVVREYLPAREAGRRVGAVITATIVGMALGGWMSGWIYDLTASYQAAFLNGIAWNMLNIAVIVLILLKSGRPRRLAATA
ncbi:MFS transporter [Stappia indica]|uniref:MFS transporter n=1 Tax=Stappia indica TaxID=538381 RepID=A0A857C790_9HYPH|nr:MFS transporter [Stappia indica]QGZ34739.1 MFS transporter [Stappia indica]